MRTALISAYDKSGIIDFARELTELGWDIIASQGTAKFLAAAGIRVRDVAELVGGEPILGHRVVTLSREIHAGLLAKDEPADRAELKRLGIDFIDLVYVGLYPLHRAITEESATTESVIEMTDIGGPALMRAAAKGRRIVVCDPADLQDVSGWIRAGEPDRQAFTDRLAAKAEAQTADYALMSAEFRSGGRYRGTIGRKAADCKYGENAWQTPAAFYAADSVDPLSLEKFRSVMGSSPSYNNLVDLDRALQTITHIAAGFDLNRGSAPNIAVGVKHGNACGAAVHDDPVEAVRNMVSGDPEAIFGGMVMTNFPLDDAMSQLLLRSGVSSGRRPLDGVFAPAFSEAALSSLKRKGGRCRCLVNPALAHLTRGSLDANVRFRFVRGGFLIQPNYTFVLDLERCERVPNSGDDSKFKSDLILAWAVGSTSNSNTVTLVKDGHLIGNGVGQQKRVACCRLAISNARNSGHDPSGAVAYSDSFFPFADGPETLADAGVAAVLSSSGSIRDDEVKAACVRRGVVLYMIPDPEGRGFFEH